MRLPQSIANTSIASGSRLLALPAEIRNQIYHYAMIESKPEPDPSLLVFSYTPDKRHLSYAGLTMDWRLHQKLWRGLAQTCRQLRSEYLSMQIPYDVHVSIKNLESYVRFVNLQARPQHAGNLQGSIVLHVDRCEPLGYDIYSALMLLRSSPQLRVRWYESCLASYGIAVDDQSVAEVILSTKFLEYIATSATQVSIVPATRDVELAEGDHKLRITIIGNVSIVLKPEIEDGLMRSSSVEAWVDSEAISVWLEDLGASKVHQNRFYHNLAPSLSCCGFICDWPHEFLGVSPLDFDFAAFLAEDQQMLEDTGA